MAGYSGKDGMVYSGDTKIAQITKWSLTCTSKNPEYSSSDAPGQTTRVAGVKDAKGSFEFKCDDTSPAYSTIQNGGTYTLKLYLNATKYLTVPAIIDDEKFDVDISGGETVSGSASFSQTAAITRPS